MRPYSLLASTLFAAALVGCATSASTPPPAVASAQAPSTVRTGQVVAVESTAAGQSGATTSSGGAGATTASSAPTRLTVRFADGTEGLYDVQQPAASFRVGQPLSVITNGSAITIVP